jgi:hypothetical protein
MAYRSNYSKGEVPCVPKSGHDNSEPEILRGWPADQGYQVPKNASYGSAENHIRWDEPPFPHVFQGH